MEEELIEHVRSRPLLYDPSNREYRNQNVGKVKVKMGVSEIVFLAELNSTKTSHNSIIIVNINTFRHLAK
jgi:hypothetical protein